MNLSVGLGRFYATGITSAVFQGIPTDRKWRIVHAYKECIYVRLDEVLSIITYTDAALWIKMGFCCGQHVKRAVLFHDGIY